MRIAQQERRKDSFVCHEGSYKYMRMKFYFPNDPASYKRALDMIISKFTRKTSLLYIYVIIIYSKTIE